MKQSKKTETETKCDELIKFESLDELEAKTRIVGFVLLIFFKPLLFPPRGKTSGKELKVIITSQFSRSCMLEVKYLRTVECFFSFVSCLDAGVTGD